MIKYSEYDLKNAVQSKCIVELKNDLLKIEPENEQQQESLNRLLKQIETAENLRWLNILNGKISIRMRPGKILLKYLSEQNVTHILTLLSEKEGTLTYKELSESYGFQWLWFPMHKAKPVSRDRNIELLSIFQNLQQILCNGGKIYIHCSAGLHRTGMITYAFLRFIGKSSMQAMEALKYLRPLAEKEFTQKRLNWAEGFIKDVFLIKKIEQNKF